MAHADADQRALHIVLFGLPGAGKSSLLGALVQASQLQEAQLGARILDTTQGLGQLHKGVYERGPAPTREEVVTYPVDVQPLPEQAALPAGAVEFSDCNGQIAGRLLGRDGGAEPQSAGLAAALQQADTLVLVVDASSEVTQLARTFAEFSDFLHVLERGRSAENQVTDLPVYLVRSKCDRLAKKTDSAAVWIQRIEERKRQVHQRFQQFMEGASGY